jgi:hypothetical protein
MGGLGGGRALGGDGVSFELDEDTAVETLGDGGRYRGTVTGRWTVGGGPNGGYLAALLLRAILADSPLPDPIAMNVHYLARPEIGECDVTVTSLREGRGHATFRAELAQGGTLRCVGLATVGRWRDPGPLDFQPTPPKLRPPEDAFSVRRIGEDPTLWERLETRAVAAEDLFSLKSEPGEAVTGGWTRLRDGRPTDAYAVALFLDSWPPAVFNRTMQPDPLGAPTIEYTVHWRKRPASDWCYGRYETRMLAGGYVDEDGELWDQSGALVAESRQIARYLGVG